MKELYKSPVITVEELAKVDVLCESPATVTFYHENNVLNASGGEIDL